MNSTWKSHLQEYCQKQKVAFPIYRLKNQFGPGHLLRFQVEVEVNGCRYLGDENCSSKKEAEQSAAKNAYENLVPRSGHTSSLQGLIDQTSETDLDKPQSNSDTTNGDFIHCRLDGNADIEEFILSKVEKDGGRIRKILPLGSQGRFRIEITGSYRYCENIRRHHKKNQIYFIVDTVNQTYTQRCHDPECYGFQSAFKHFGNNRQKNIHAKENISVTKCEHCSNSINYQNRSDCDRCGKIFCENCVRECDLCHSAIHCERCFELCFDCHDS